MQEPIGHNTEFSHSYRVLSVTMAQVNRQRRSTANEKFSEVELFGTNPDIHGKV
jgi:hypothetical protein